MQYFCFLEQASLISQVILSAYKKAQPARYSTAKKNVW